MSAVASPSLSGVAALAVVVGAGLGGLLRWLLALVLHQGPGAWLPWGTLAANLLGGLLVGVALHLLGEANPLGLDPQRVVYWRLLCVTGFLGGLTTFSTFSSEVVSLMLQGRWGMAGAWAAAHLAGSLLLTAAGLALSRLLLSGRILS